MAARLSTKPYRIVLAWQAAATALIAVVAGTWVGVHGALSAVLGGVINLSACVVYAFVLAVSPARSAGATMAAMFRAEAAKVLVIIGQLWLVLANYRDVVLPAMFAAFIITVLLFGVSLFARD